MVTPPTSITRHFADGGLATTTAADAVPDWELVRRGVTMVLQGLRCDLADANFIETPDRVSRAYQEAFSGSHDTEAQVSAILSSTFPCSHDQVVIANDIEVFSYCPHHLLPVRYVVTVGYMPGGAEARVVGLSKLCRLVEVFARRPVLQEQMVNDVAEALMRIPGCIGAGCIAHGEHYCIRMRGVRQNAVVTTISLRGMFLSNSALHNEFITLSKR